MAKASGLLLTFLIVGTLVNAQFNPRFHPIFASSFSQQRNLAPFAEFNGYGRQAPYGSPLFGSNEISMMEQQMFGMSPYSRRHSFAQFAGPSPISPMMSMHQGGFGSLPPAFASLSGGMNPVAGRSPFQREPGVPMNGLQSGFNELEPFQMSLDTETAQNVGKQKRSTITYHH